MDEIQVKHVIEAALLAAGRPLSFDTLASLFSSRGSELEKETLERALSALAEDYRERGLELKEVASGYRVQVRSSMSDWLTPLWEERAPRYTRALLETLALICYRQPITRAEIEEVRGVAVSTNIVRTLMERNWIRVVGHRDVPGKPAMFGTTRDFLDYFGLKKLEELPALADIKDGLPELSPQTDFLEVIQGGAAIETEELAAESDADTPSDAQAETHAQSEEGGPETSVAGMATEAETETETETAEVVDEDEVADETDDAIVARVAEHTAAAELAGDADADLAADGDAEFADDGGAEFADDGGAEFADDGGADPATATSASAIEAFESQGDCAPEAVDPPAGRSDSAQHVVGHQDADSADTDVEAADEAEALSRVEAR